MTIITITITRAHAIHMKTNARPIITIITVLDAFAPACR
jgi:hypothetical protein